MADKALNLQREPTDAELRANGGRLLANLALRLIYEEEGYDAYLRTNHWQNVRAMAYRVYGCRCTIGVQCAGPLDVHHIRYDNLGDEPPEDLEVLCRLHHGMKHDCEKAFVRAQGYRQFRNL